MDNQKVKKVNIGCGPISKDDWVNVDYGIVVFLHRYHLASWMVKTLEVLRLTKVKRLEQVYSLLKMSWPQNLQIHNCLKRLPFKDESVDFIFSSHFLEHVKYYQVLGFLKEVYRVLKKGAIVRVSVPDLAILIKKYADRDFDFFMRNSYVGWKKEFSLDKKLLLGDAFCGFFYPYPTKDYQGIFMDTVLNKFVRWHNWHYDFESLSDLLKRAGFGQVYKRSYRVGDVPDLVDLDAHSEESLYVEATK